MRALFALPKDQGDVHSDAWGLKKLFSYGCRKSGYDKDLEKSPHRRDTHLKWAHLLSTSLSQLDDKHMIIYVDSETLVPMPFKKGS